MDVDQAKRWIRNDPDPGQCLLLTRALKVSDMAARLLVNRGLADPATAHAFLNPRPDELHDPFLMKDMRQAVDRIMRAASRGEKVLIYGDYDVDGTTSTIILKRALAMTGVDVSYFIPERIKDGYGLRAEGMDRARNEGCHLVISVDTGIRAHDVIEHANSIGLDVIVTDHHLPDQTLPRACAILNPKRDDCGYPNKNLAGVGVAFKLVQALLNQTGRERYTQSFMKIAAIGTIADIVPLVGENRVIAKFGLEGLARPRNPGLEALLQSAGLDGRPVSGSDVAFRLAPRINATGRMAWAKAAVDLFDAPDIETGARLAAEIEEQNVKRQAATSEIVDQVMTEIEADPTIANSRVVVVAGEGWHRGVIGIAASRVVEALNRPAIVISLEDGVGHGSARSLPCFHMLKAMESCRDLLRRFGGHAQAAGLVIPAESIPELRDRINSYANAVLTDDDLLPCIATEGELPLKSAKWNTAVELRQFEPFGIGNPQPVFEAHDVDITHDPDTIKDRHLKLLVRQHGKSAQCVWWGEARRSAGLSRGDRVNLAYSIAENQVGDFISVQIELKDLTRIG